MSDRIATLRLDRTTTPKQLEEFLAEEATPSKVRGKKNDDGSVTLFTSDRATGLWGKLTGLSKERETARTALDRWFRYQYGQHLSSEARQALNGRMEVGNVRQLAHNLQLADQQQNDWVLVPNEQFPGDELPPPPPIDDNQIPQDNGLQVQREPFPRNGVLTPGEDGSIRPPLKLTFDGEDYTVKKEKLGKGGQGDVYEAVSKNGFKLVLKIPHKLEEAEREFLVHRRAVGPDRDLSHIVGLKGAATDSKGRIQAIVLEHMPGGDAKSVLTQLRDAERDGKISREDARLIRLTIARDMASALAQLHQARSLLHFDVKPDNFLIGSDGVARLADFGTSLPDGEMQGRRTAEFSGTALYVSPEAFGARDRIEALDAEITRLESRPNELGFTKEALAERAKELREQIDTTSIDAKSDVFSLGLSLAYAFEGKNLGGSDRNALDDVQALGTSDGLERGEVLSHLGIISNSPEHELIREMLSVNPKDRPTAQQVVDKLPSEDKIGSPEIRKLLYDVAQGKFAPMQGNR